MKWLACSDPRYPQPARKHFRGEMPVTPRLLWMVRFYRPGPGHIYFPPGYKERLATRGALAAKPEDEEDA